VEKIYKHNTNVHSKDVQEAVIRLKMHSIWLNAYIIEDKGILVGS